MVIKKLKRISIRKYLPERHLLRLEIDKKRFFDNVSNIRNIIGTRKLGVVLKSNAYGHGLNEIGALSEECSDVDILFVDSIVEAELLRRAGIKKRIIILGYVPIAKLSYIKRIKNITLVINSLKQAVDVSDVVDFYLDVHIKVDTGMNRNGVTIDKFSEIIDVLNKNKKIQIKGMMTHLADADSKNKDNTLKQLKKWGNALSLYYEKIGRDGEFHFSATAGLEYLDIAFSNMVRVGIGVYGFDTTPSRILKVKPILSFWAKIVNIKNIKNGDGIGYNLTYVADKDVYVYTLPCGYNEGVPRCLSNNGCVFFNGEKLSMLGRVSMNLISVGPVSNSKISLIGNKEVEVFSNNPKRCNSIENVAKLCNTIPYEILTGLSYGIRRVIV